MTRPLKNKKRSRSLIESYRSPRRFSVIRSRRRAFVIETLHFKNVFFILSLLVSYSVLSKTVCRTAADNSSPNDVERERLRDNKSVGLGNAIFV